MILMKRFILVVILICTYSLSQAADPVVGSITLFKDDNGGTTTSTTEMTPNDEMTLVVEVGYELGFNKIYCVKFYIWASETTRVRGTDTPTDHATYLWGNTSVWKLVGPLSSTWTIDEGNCKVATTTTSTGTFKLVFTPGKVSRYDQDKNWQISINVQPTGGPSFDTIQGEMNVSNAFYSQTNIDKDAFFTSNFAGTNDNPSQLNLNIIANGTYTLKTRAEDFVGEGGTISLPGPLGYALTNTVTSQATITTTEQIIGTYSITSEQGATQSLYLWLDYPVGLHSGTYNSRLSLKTSPPGTTSEIEAVATLTGYIKKPELGSLTFTLAPATGIAGADTLFALERLDAFLFPMIEGMTTLTLSSNSSGSYTFKPGTATLIIPDGTSTAIFYYNDELAGNWTIAAKAGGVATITTSILINPAGYVAFTAENLPTEISHPGQTNLEILKILAENSYASTKTITSIKLTNLTQGSGTQTNLDAQISRLSLSGTSTTFSCGEAFFNNLNISIPPGTSTFLITYDLSLSNVKDGDIIDIQMEEITFTPLITVQADFPLNSYGHHLVDGMISAQIKVNDVLPDSFKSGESNNLVLDIVIPANGYAEDTLNYLGVENAGTADKDDITLKLWIDDGDGVFQSGTDTYLGTMYWTDALWQKTGIKQTIPIEGLKVFITADITEIAGEGKTIKMRIPIKGIEVLSENDGPVDQPVDNYYSQRIKVYNKVVFEALDLLKEKVYPGNIGVDILRLAMSNYYIQETQTLTSLSMTNANIGSGSKAQLDSEVDTLYLYEGNNIIDTNIIGMSNYKAGKAIFSGLNISLAPEETKYLQVRYDVSQSNAKDGDMIDGYIYLPSDISFKSGTASIGGIFPLNSFGFQVIDGLVNAQIINYGAQMITVATGTTDVLVLDVLIQGNGYAPDTLTKMRFKNSGTARDLRDIKTIKLCVDANTYTATWNQEYWEWIGTISTPCHILVKVDIADEPIKGSTIMMKIPVNGLEFVSDNDGPIDSEVINPYVQTISEGLLSSLKLVLPTVAVGGTVTVVMSVKNTSTEDVHTVTPTALILEEVLPQGIGSVTLISVPASLATLPADSSTEFIWKYKAVAPGTLTFSGYATSTTLDSIPTYSEILYIQEISNKLVVKNIPTMPFEVNEGQCDIIPMSIIFENPATATFTGGIEIGTLTFDVGTTPCQAIAGITLMRGGVSYGSRTDIETADKTIILPLTTPIVVFPNQSMAVNLIIEIPTSTTVNSFQISLPGTQSIAACDVNSKVEIPSIEGFPLKSSGYTNIKKPSQGVTVILLGNNKFVNRGQLGVLAGQMEFKNEGLGVSEVKVTQITLNSTINLNQAITKVTIKDADMVYAEKAIAADKYIELFLSPGITLFANVTKTVDVIVDVVENPSVSEFQFGSVSVIARDSNTGQEVGVFSTGTTPSIKFQNPAQEAIVTGTSTIPPKVYPGQSGIKAFELKVINPGGTNTASILLTEVTLNIPSNIPSAIWGIIIEGGFGTYTDKSGTQTLQLVTPATVTPQATVTFNLKIDLRQDANLGECKLNLLGLTFVDANDLRVIPSVFLPILALTQIQEKPKGLAVSSQSLIPVNVSKDDKDIPALRLTFTNQGGTNTDVIKIATITLGVSNRFKSPISAAAVLSKVILSYEGTQTTAIPLTGSNIIINVTPPLEVAVDKSKVMDVTLDISSVATAKDFRISLLVDVQATDDWGNPVDITGVFPMWSESATIFEPDFENSFTNYPNPFAAGKESTTISYYLPQDAYVTIKIYSVIGDIVITLLEDSFKSRGMYQEDRWDGRNGEGEIVLNGVYFCQIKVNYLAGGSDKKVRKIAVVR
ncbi:MAG: hypothetical protein ABIF11_00245 [Nitrospirota bacterium]